MQSSSVNHTHNKHNHSTHRNHRLGQIHGTVSAGFEPVRELFETNMQQYRECHTQLCIYVDGEVAVDLWSSADSSIQPDPEHLINIFSSGKSLESVAFAWAWDKGYLTYEQPIAELWPEFAKHGKDSLTVADLMRHEAGLAGFDQSLPLDALQTSAIKDNAVGRVIEQQQPQFRSNSEREYHALTRGWIANEIFRRCEPQGRTIGEFLHDELCPALSDNEHAVAAIVGVQAEQLPRRIPVEPVGVGWTLRESLRARGTRRTERNTWELMRRLAPVAASLSKRTRTKAPPPIAEAKSIGGMFNHPLMISGETPSANTHSNARSLARIAAMLADGGQLNGQAFLSEAAWQAMHAAPKARDMGFAHTTFTQGGVAQFGSLPEQPAMLDRGLNVGREGFYGWMGLGGSLFQWHPERRIGFGYVPSSLNILDLVNERGKSYQQAVLNCVG